MASVLWEIGCCVDIASVRGIKRVSACFLGYDGPGQVPFWYVGLNMTSQTGSTCKQVQNFKFSSVFWSNDEGKGSNEREMWLGLWSVVIHSSDTLIPLLAAFLHVSWRPVAEDTIYRFWQPIRSRAALGVNGHFVCMKAEEVKHYGPWTNHTGDTWSFSSSTSRLQSPIQ